MANSVESDQTAPIGAVCSSSTLFAFLRVKNIFPSDSLQQTWVGPLFMSCVHRLYLPFSENQFCLNKHCKPI